jgi:hypothetical protein
MIKKIIELEESIRGKGNTIGITPIISKEVLIECIANPSREIKLINYFLTTLKRGMGHIPK